jgi:hypothetical protein
MRIRKLRKRNENQPNKQTVLVATTECGKLDLIILE